MNKSTLWKVILAVELAIAVTVILLDLLIPTLVILAIIAVSFLLRREHITRLGFKKDPHFGRMALQVFGLVLLWTLLQLGLFMPVLNHLTGTTQDLSTFADLKGNTGKLLTLLAFTWTLAAFGEEMVYRGYLQTRLMDLFGSNRLGIGIAVALTSVLFGLAHSEQGIIGVVITTLDSLFFSWLKFQYKNNLWAAILAHGFSNTVGLVGFYIVGPIYGLW